MSSGNECDNCLGDNWVILCNNQEEGSILMGSSIFDLKHVLTGRYLYTDIRHMFNQHNCGYNCPTFGQIEVSADRYASSSTKWKVSSVIPYNYSF